MDYNLSTPLPPLAFESNILRFDETNVISNLTNHSLAPDLHLKLNQEQNILINYTHGHMSPI